MCIEGCSLNRYGSPVHSSYSLIAMNITIKILVLSTMEAAQKSIINQSKGCPIFSYWLSTDRYTDIVLFCIVGYPMRFPVKGLILINQIVHKYSTVFSQHPSYNSLYTKKIRGFFSNCWLEASALAAWITFPLRKKDREKR